MTDASIYEDLSWTCERTMKEARVIKKYPNRRLYDTMDSRYITLSDIRQLVVDGERFEVIDKKSGEQITRSILLHVIAEQEERGESVMSEDFLARIIRAYSGEMPRTICGISPLYARIIRAYSGEMPQMVRGYLEEALAFFLDEQQRLDESTDGDGISPSGQIPAGGDKAP